MAERKRGGTHSVSRSWNSPVLVPSELRSHSNCVAEGPQSDCGRLEFVPVWFLCTPVDTHSPEAQRRNKKLTLY